MSRPFMNRSNSVVRATTEFADASNLDALVGRKLWTRWPEDNNFYEAIVTAYNPAEVCFEVSKICFYFKCRFAVS